MCYIAHLEGGSWNLECGVCLKISKKKKIKLESFKYLIFTYIKNGHLKASSDPFL